MIARNTSTQNHLQRQARTPRISAVLIASGLAYACLHAPAHAQPADGSKPPLEITNVSSVNADVQFVRVTAEIHNRSDRWACAPRMLLRLRDAQDQDLTVTSIASGGRPNEREEMAVASRRWLPPGGMSPVEYVRDHKNISGKAAKVAARAGARDCSGTPPDVKVEGFATETTSKGWIKASGSIVVGGGTCRAPAAVIAVYAPDGTIHRVYTVNPVATSTVASAGQRFDFTRTSIPVLSDAPTIKVWGDCSAYQ